MEQLVAAVKATSILPVHVTSLLWGRVTGKESGVSMMQRLGMAYAARGPGPLIWFHAATTAECAVALPVLFRCLQEYNEKVGVLLTTASLDAYHMLCSSLPRRVKVQLSPMDNSVCAGLFIRKWRPTVGIIVESPFHPHLVLAAAQYGCRLALVNAHMEPRDLLAWHAQRAARNQLGQVLKQFSLIVPQSDVDVGRFRIFGASMKQMPGWCNELKYAALMGGSLWHLWKAPDATARQLQDLLSGRPHWLAANTVAGEEEVVARLHQQLAAHLPGLITVLVPQDPGRCPAVQMQLVSQAGLTVCLWNGDTPLDGDAADMDVLLIDDPRQLPLLYSICEVTLMCNSLLSGCTGHNLAQAAVAGCALLLGPNAGSCLNMADELNNAALLAAEDAAAAVRNTGALLEEPLGWEAQEPSPSAAANSSPSPNAEASSQYADDALAELQGTSSAAIRQRLQQRLSLQQRDSRPAGAALTGTRPATAVRPRTSLRESLAFHSVTRPSTAPAHTTQTLLLSQASQWTTSDCTDCDSLCSDGDLTPRQIVQCLYGSPSSIYTSSFSPASVYTQHYSPGHGDEQAPQPGGHPWVARRSLMLQGQLSPRASGTYTPTRLSSQYSERVPSSSPRHTSSHPARSAQSYAPRSGAPHTLGLTLSVLTRHGGDVRDAPRRQSSHAACQVCSLDSSALQQPQPAAVAGHLALQGPSGTRRSLDMSMPSSPQSAIQGHTSVLCDVEALAEPVRRWDRMFAAAALDPVPWNSPASSTCSPGTPPNLNTRPSRHGHPGASTAASTRNHSSRSAAESRLGLQRASVRLLSDACTQTELSWLAGDPSPRSRAATPTAAPDANSMPVLLAAMLGAFSGAQAAQGVAPSLLANMVLPVLQAGYDTGLPDLAQAHLALTQLQGDGSSSSTVQAGLHSRHGVQPPTDKRVAAATFTPAMLHMRVLEASLAGLVDASQNTGSTPQSPAPVRPSTADASTLNTQSAVGMLQPGALLTFPSGSYMHHGVAAGRDRSPLSVGFAGVANTLAYTHGISGGLPMVSHASSPAATTHSSELQAQSLNVRVPYSTWTATSTPSRSPSPTKPNSPVSLEQSVAFSSSVTSSPGMTNGVITRDTVMGMVAASGPQSAFQTADCGWAQEMLTQGPAIASALAWPQPTTARSNSASSKPDGLTAEQSAMWGPSDAEEDGPELSSKSAPNLLSSFEFQPSGSVPDQVQPLLLAGSSALYRPASRLLNEHNRRTQSLDIVRPSTSITATTAAAVPSTTTSQILGLEVSPVKAPQPVVPRSDSTRRKTVCHSDPGSPGCSSHPSSASTTHSDSLWTRSDSGSPTDPALRASVSGWMGDLMSARSPVRAGGPNSPPRHPADCQTPPPAAACGAAGVSALEVPCAVPEHTGPVGSAGQPTARAWSTNGTRDGSLVVDSSRRASLPSRPPPDALPVSSNSDQGSGALQHSPVTLSPASSTSGALRKVRTPRATDPEPVLTNDGVLLPPPSPRASLSPRSSFAPDMPPSSPRHQTAAGTAAGADVRRSLDLESHASTTHPLDLVQLQALASSPTPGTMDASAQPDTPTSRLSAMQSVTSPFAGSVYDRPDPFSGAVMDRPDPFVGGAEGWKAQGSGSGRMRGGFQSDGTLVLRGNSICGNMGPNPFLLMNGLGMQSSDGLDAGLTALAADLAQQQPVLVTPPPLGDVGMQASDSEPPTPTSRLSAMQSVTSPFATTTYDRPNPFYCSEFAQPGNSQAAQGPQNGAAMLPTATAGTSLAECASALNAVLPHVATGTTLPALLHNPLERPVMLSTEGAGGSCTSSPQRCSSYSGWAERPTHEGNLGPQQRFAGSRFFSQANSGFKAAAASAVAMGSMPEANTTEQSVVCPSPSTTQPDGQDAGDGSQPETPRMQPRASLESCSSAAWLQSPACKNTPQLMFDDDSREALVKDAGEEDWAEAAMPTLSQPLSPRAPVRRLFDDAHSMPLDATTTNVPVANQQLRPPTSMLHPTQCGNTQADMRAQLLHTVLEFATTLQASNRSEGGASSSRAAAGSPQLQQALRDMLGALCDVDGITPMSPTPESVVSRSDGSSATLMLAPSASLPSSSLHELSTGFSGSDLRVDTSVVAGLQATGGIISGPTGSFSSFGLGQSTPCESVTLPQSAFHTVLTLPSVPAQVSAHPSRDPALPALNSGMLDATTATIAPGVAVYQTDRPPEGSAPLVLPGAAGPVLVAAPAELVTRLSRQLSVPHSPQGVPCDTPNSTAGQSRTAATDQDGMELLMASLPQRLPRLRVPSTCIPGVLPATARAGDDGRAPITALAVTMPQTAPAAAAATYSTSLFRDVAAVSQTVSQYPQPAVSVAVAVRPLPSLTCRTSVTPRSSTPLVVNPQPGSGVQLSRPLGPLDNQPSTLAQLPLPTPSSMTAVNSSPLAPVTQQRMPASQTQDHKWGHATEPAKPLSVQDFLWQDPAATLAAKATNPLPSTSAAAAANQPAVTLTGSHLAPSPDSPHGMPPALHGSSRAAALAEDTAAGQGGRGQDTSLNRSLLQSHAAVGAGSRFVLPANQLSRTTGPAVWVITGNTNTPTPPPQTSSNEAVEAELATALLALLQDPLDRRSRGHAAAQAAAKLASGLVNTVWHVLDDTCITPALHGYVATGTSR